MARKSKVEQALSVKELHEFCKRAAELKNPTLARIKDLAAEFGIEMSLMAAKTFRDGAFDKHLRNIRRSKEQTQQILDVVGEGHSISAGIRAHTQQQLFDALSSSEETDAAELARILWNVTRSEVVVQDLELKIQDYKRKEIERAEKKNAAQKIIDGAKGKGGITKKTLKQLEEAVGLL